MRPLGSTPRSTAVLLAVLSTLVAAVFGAGPAAADTPDTGSASGSAAGWLARQLVDGDHFEAVFGNDTFPDQGLTADAVLAFDAAGVAQDYAAAATEWLGQPQIMSGYIGSGDESYPGALAKLALVAIAQGEDPEAFGEDEVDLIGLLEDREDPTTGRFSDKSQFGDFTNGITQSLAIITLLRADETADVAKPADFLAASQCDDGGFPLEFGQQTCTSEADVTGFAIQALLAAGRTDVADDALDYLEKVQDGSGGFGGTGPTSGLNANSTGLAAQALRAGGRADAADAAARFLLDLQVGCDGPAEQRGAVAYDSAGFEASTAVRATAQALYGLSGVGLSEVDNTGDTDGAPELECAPPTTTSSAAAPTTTAPPPQGGTGAGELPATGVRPAPAAAVGILLVLAGCGAVLVSRRRAQRS